MEFPWGEDDRLKEHTFQNSLTNIIFILFIYLLFSRIWVHLQYKSHQFVPSKHTRTSILFANAIYENRLNSALLVRFRFFIEHCLLFLFFFSKYNNPFYGSRPKKLSAIRENLLRFNDRFPLRASEDVKYYRY